MGAAMGVVMGLAMGVVRAMAMAALVLVAPAWADSRPWRVIDVDDGDSFLAQDASGQTQRVRISGIDAPERRQPFSAQAKARLTTLLVGRSVWLRSTKQDTYGRAVAQVWLIDAACAQPPDCPRRQDVGLTQVREGWAWWYRAYAREQSAQDQRRYAAAEDSARAQRLGLWRDARPLPPWVYRRLERGQDNGR
jgi:endonuclease YncB( thermonuclease family)